MKTEKPKTTKAKLKSCVDHPGWGTFLRWACDNQIIMDVIDEPKGKECWRPYWNCFLVGFRCAKSEGVNTDED